MGSGDGLEGVARIDELVALEDLAQHGDGFGGELGEVGEGAGLDLAVFAVALAEEESGRGGPVGDGGDIHANHI